MSESSGPTGTVLLGVGNPLMGDDGLGLAAIERVRNTWRVDPAVEIVDGGTWGMNLLPTIEDASRLLIVDAVDADRPPGSFVRLERDEVPRFLSQKLSPHQIDLREVLALADLRGTLPAATLVLGLQPEVVEMSTELSQSVRDGLHRLTAEILAQLDTWGHSALASDGSTRS